jgi:hypothetical protein
MNTFFSTLDLLAALKAAIAPMQFAGGQVLFDRVEFFSEPDPVKALVELNLFKDRICLIVPDSDTFDHTREGRTCLLYTSDAADDM